MAEVIIHRCTLRVVRRRGWSWGPSPQQLLKAAVAALPLLIARKLRDLLQDDIETEITEPLRLTVPVNLIELLELGAASISAEAGSSHSTEALDQRLTAAIALAFTRELAAAHEVRAPKRLAEATVDFETQQTDERKIQGRHVLNLLLRWKQRGELEIHLNSFAEEELEAWYSALMATVLELAGATEVIEAEAASRLIRELMQRLQRVAPDRRAFLRTGLIALLDVGGHLQHALSREVSVREILAQLSERLGVPPDEQPTKDFEEQLASKIFGGKTTSPELLLPHEPAVMSTAQVTIPRSAQTEFHVRSVLPFLMLGPLARIGYLDALAATLETLGLSHEAFVFATALAYKVVSPPARGWRRDDEDLIVAAAFAGVESPPPGDALAELARKMSGHLTPLDSLLSYTLVNGHRPGDPMLLHRVAEENGSEGLLLVEVEGFFPVAWGADVESLMPTLRYFNETHLLIPQAAAHVETLRGLHASGFRFITDAPPTRGEAWRELRRTSRERCYSNDTDAKETTLFHAAEALSEAAEEIDELWQALKGDRPAIPTLRHSELERSLTVAASLGLGMISWVLWRNRETSTPILALERFGNLEGKVRFKPDAIEVHLPLGQRQRDLYDHKLLADIHSVPWLDGRTVEFFGG